MTIEEQELLLRGVEEVIYCVDKGNKNSALQLLAAIHWRLAQPLHAGESLIH